MREHLYRAPLYLGYLLVFACSVILATQYGEHGWLPVVVGVWVLWGGMMAVEKLWEDYEERG